MNKKNRYNSYIGGQILASDFYNEPIKRNSHDDPQMKTIISEDSQGVEGVIEAHYDKKKASFNDKRLEDSLNNNNIQLIEEIIMKDEVRYFKSLNLTN